MQAANLRKNMAEAPMKKKNSRGDMES